LECERGEGVWGRVRELIGDGQSISKNPPTTVLYKTAGRRMWEVWVITRWLGIRKLDDEAHRLRHIFSTWSEDSSVRGSSVFWRLWIELELRLQMTGKAKMLLFQAVSHCAPDKDIYLLPFGPLRTEFKKSELDHWVEFIIERGMRLRRDLGPYLLDWKEEDEKSGRGDEETLDEVEHRAAEYRRLLPYK